MQAVQALIKIPEVSQIMREFSKEMMKAGIMEEMVNDTFESMEDQEELEEAADEEIDNVNSKLISNISNQRNVFC